MSIKPEITIIGASNIDLIGYPNEKLIYTDSNSGIVETIFGGVGRNIAENLSRLGFKVEFLSVFGQDDFAKRIIESCKALDISTEHCYINKNSSSSVFMAIMDHQNDLALGFDAMSIYDQIPDSFIMNNLDVISQNDYCVLETNMPKRILELVTNKLSGIHFALDAVSGKKALKAKSILDKLTILKCNLLEAELLSNIKVKSENNYKDIILYFIDIGVNKVFITLGENGVIYGDANGFYKIDIDYLKPMNTTGAGDSFMAGLLYGEIQKFNIHKMVQFANACAQMTVQHKNTVNPKINEKLILKIIS